MQVVILAGGLGRRIQGVAGGLPKSLIPVRGRPFIDHQLELLARCELRDILLCIGHLGEQIIAHLDDGHRLGMRVAYSREDPDRLLGTGGALVRALPLLKERFLVLYGDSYLPVDFRAFANAFAESGRPGMMSVYRNQNQWDRSNVRAEAGRVVYYNKQAPDGAADSIDYGLNAFTRETIEAYEQTPLPLDLSRILGDLVARQALAAWPAPDRFYEIGKPEGLRDLEERLDAAPPTPASPAPGEGNG